MTAHLTDDHGNPLVYPNHIMAKIIFEEYDRKYAPDNTRTKFRDFDAEEGAWIRDLCNKMTNDGAHQLSLYIQERKGRETKIRELAIKLYREYSFKRYVDMPEEWEHLKEAKREMWLDIARETIHFFIEIPNERKADD